MEPTTDQFLSELESQAEEVQPVTYGILDPITGDYVDPDTGEILPPPPERVNLEDAPRVAQAIRANRKRRMHFEKPVPNCHCTACIKGRHYREVRERAEDYLSKATEAEGKYMARMKELMAAADLKKMDTLVGNFSFRQKPESVDATAFDALSPEVREKMADEFPALFNKTVTIKPDRKAIKETINSGKEVPGCALTRGEPDLYFKES